ncbi:MAG: hypothetical protein AAB546_01030 [Patescibacteria group bacterium]
MKKILLIVPSKNLRQLYHENLSQKQVEIVAVDSLATAVVLLIVEKFDAVVWHSTRNYEIRLFLKIRQGRKKWLKTKLFIVTNCKNIDMENISGEVKTYKLFEWGLNAAIEKISKEIEYMDR